ncbi:MAG: hypothetical protein WCP35_06575 [Verrucomicrobiota bacterium]
MANVFGILTAIVLALASFVAYKNKDAYANELTHRKNEDRNLAATEARLKTAQKSLAEFCVSPELIATRLFCPVMEKDEAILVEGAERYSEPVGYGWDLGFGGPFTDMSPVVHGRSLDSWVVAIDASDFRGGNRNSQFEPAGIIRELNKAWAGFSMPGAPDRIATGNWGCGLFKGDVELKSILQWLAASRAGRAIHYHPWNEERVYRELPPLAERLCASRITVGEVTRALLGGVAPRRCYTQLRDTYAAT